jgi:hypothetical protein
MQVNYLEARLLAARAQDQDVVFIQMAELCLDHVELRGVNAAE